MFSLDRLYNCCLLHFFKSANISHSYIHDMMYMYAWQSYTAPPFFQTNSLSPSFLLSLLSSLSPPSSVHPSIPPVVLVVSSSCPDPLESFSKLFTKQRQSEQGKYPKWITPHVYYYHVLLHDSTSCPEARSVIIIIIS